MERRAGTGLGSSRKLVLKIFEVLWMTLSNVSLKEGTGSREGHSHGEISNSGGAAPELQASCSLM